MATTFILLILIYGIAIFFWIRYLYKHSLKKSEDRANLFHSLKRLLPFTPIGLQAIFLFCFALWHAIPLGNKLSDFTEFNVFSPAEPNSPDFRSLRIIFIGSLLLTTQYLLLKKNFFYAKSMNLIATFLIFLGSIFLLRLLTINIYRSLSSSPSAELTVFYNNNYMWGFCILLALTSAILKDDWVYKRQMDSLKYLHLTSRLLLYYSLLIASPRIISIVFKHV